jgi:glutathione synthase
VLVSYKVNIGFVMDPLEEINPAKDSTLMMMLAAKDLGAKIFTLHIDDLYMQDGSAMARMRQVDVFDDTDKWYEGFEYYHAPLSSLDIIFMRKDPPVDKRFIHACYVLEMAERNGVYVSNPALSLIDLNEKIYATHFPQFSAPYVITADKNVLSEFLNSHENIIIKPLDSMGGEGIFMVKKGDVNFEVIWEVQTNRGKYPVMAQRFIPEIAQGDKRILIVCGKPFGHAMARLPKDGSIRGNLAAGGRYEIMPLTDREWEISNAVAKDLLSRNIEFAGLDVIGDYLTEVNITSPTGLRQLSVATGQKIAHTLIQGVIERSGK